MNLVDYLGNGALISILRTYGGANPQPVWITPEADGGYHHGISQEPTSVGGQPTPLQAIQGGKIFRPKESEVTEYLQTFGLSKAEAELVIQRVGTDPPEVRFDDLKGL